MLLNQEVRMVNNNLAPSFEVNPHCKFKCLICQNIFPISTRFTCPSCNGALECYYGEKPFKLGSQNNIWRFAEILPLLPDPIVTCPSTNIQKIQDPILSNYQIYGKIEGELPSRSTKYRQCAMTVPMLIKLGIKEIVVASSGNTGSSFMFWSELCAGQFKTHVFSSELHKNRLYFKGPNSEIHICQSDLVKTEAAAKKYAYDHDFFYEGGFLDPFRREGLKTSYLEGIFQLDWDVDVVIQAISSGMGIVGAQSALTQLKYAGLIKKIPRIVCVQQDTCCPMIEADKAGLEVIPQRLIKSNPDGLAKAILRGDPTLSYPYVRQVVHQTRGCFHKVTQEEIQKAFLILQKANIAACHTSATTLAACRNLANSGWIKANERCLLLLTGGLLTEPDRYFSPGMTQSS